MTVHRVTTDTRVWSIKNKAGPNNPPIYQGCMKAGSIVKPKGEPTIVTCPDPNKFHGFKIVGKVPGEEGLPGLTIMARYTEDASDLLEWLNRGCDVDLQMHIGRCKSPLDHLEGWDKILVLEAAQPGDYSMADFGALEQADLTNILEEMPFKGQELYEIRQMAFEEQAEDEVVQEILAIIVCDNVSCGDCADPSDGCEKVFAITVTVGGSPGARAELIFTADAGTVWQDTEIDTLPADEEPTDLACVGLNVVVISNDSDSLHYAAKADILTGTETWVAMATGFVAAGSPNAIVSISPRHTWIVGDGGYVYFTQDPTNSVVVQTAGTVVTDDLNAIHALDTEDVVAVGDDNALIVTRNGGDVWTAVTGPRDSVVLTAVWMRNKDEWWVGCADGTLWYTIDAGVNWTQKILPDQANITEIADIKFSTQTVGWVVVKIGDTPAGRILRSINGGYEWYLAPEGNRTLPANDHINEIAICTEDPNLVYAGGLSDAGDDGIVMKGSG